VLAIDPHFQVYGNHGFSVQPVRPRSLGSRNQPESVLTRRGTENSSFPYIGVKGNLPYFAGFWSARLARIALARASIFVASVVRSVFRSRAA